MVGIDTVTKESLRGERLPPEVSGSVTVHPLFICKKGYQIVQYFHIPLLRFIQVTKIVQINEVYKKT